MTHKESVLASLADFRSDLIQTFALTKSSAPSAEINAKFREALQALDEITKVVGMLDESTS